MKRWCFWTVVLEKTLESPLDCKEVKPVNPKGNKTWIFIARTDAEAEAPKLLPPDVNSRLIRKDPDAGKDWRQEEKIEVRGRDNWMASPTQRTWIWAASGRWSRTGRPGMLQYMGSQTVGHGWVTEQQVVFVFAIRCFSWVFCPWVSYSKWSLGGFTSFPVWQLLWKSLNLKMSREPSRCVQGEGRDFLPALQKTHLTLTKDGPTDRAMHIECVRSS